LAGERLVLGMGEVVLSDIFMQADVNRKHKLTMTFNPSIFSNVTIRVHVRGCVPGENEDETGQRCNLCGQGRFSFNTTEDCDICPVNAECSNSILTPKNGTWHSTSKSIQIHDCILKSACNYDNRSALLMASASAAHVQGGTLSHLDVERYQQCLKGYHGILCGACDETHGKLRSGYCQKCGSWAKNMLFTCLVSFWLVILTAALIKNALISYKYYGTKNERQQLGLRRPPTESIQAAGPSMVSADNPQMKITIVGPNMADAPKDGVRAAEGRDDDRNYSSEIFKVLINFLQVTGIATSINVDWTSSVVNVLGATDLMTSGGDGLFSFDCVFSNAGPIPRSMQHTIVSILFPCVVVVFFMAFWSIVAFCKSKPLSYLFTHWRVSILSTLYIFYLDITRSVLKIFECIDVDLENGNKGGHSIAISRYWVTDTDVVCHKGSHLLLLFGLGIPFLVLVSFGMPLGLLIVLVRWREKLHDRSFLDSYGFLYRSYRPECRYWEVVIMLRKGLMAAVAVFAYSLGPDLQNALGMGVLFFAIFIHQLQKPYVTRGPKLNMMEGLSIFSSFLIFFTGIIFDNPKTSATGEIVISIALISILIGLLCYLLTQLGAEAFRTVEVKLVEKRIPVSQEATAVKKIWLLTRFMASDMFIKFRSSSNKVLAYSQKTIKTATPKKDDVVTNR